MLGNLTSSIYNQISSSIFKGEIIQIIASQSIFYDQYHTNEGRGWLSTPNILLLQIHNMRGAWQILNEVISEEDGFLCHIIESQSSKYTPGVLSKY